MTRRYRYVSFRRSDPAAAAVRQVQDAADRGGEKGEAARIWLGQRAARLDQYAAAVEAGKPIRFAG
jgi:hypothetical protein